MLPANPGAAAQQQRPDGLTAREQAYQLRMGERGYQRFETIKRQERQRVWDNMRSLAAGRYKAGLMPPWFKKEWLDIEEAPTNTWWRQQGLSAYRTDTSWLGESAPSSSSGDGGGLGGSGSGGAGGNGDGWRWWREEDPYWPLRDWGDHPMRWWTWGLAAALAAGGVFVHAQTGCPSAAHLGIGSGALLGMAAVAMSDIRGGNPLGELGVKAAFAVCAALAFSDFSGRGLKPCPQQQQQHWGGSSSSSSSSSSFRGTGWLCMCSALLYMWTGMAGLSSYALPTNPGEAFKMVDVAQRHKVWDYWGYGDLTMRV
ncbi:hypothetical protein OEZ86_004420 [Tetradesmus obliquus]|nr:hypothetical protein OEZ86_004420 [Tetradesmus obliquus]